MKKYILLYSDRKEEDNICLCDMFKNNCKINIGWTNIDYMHNRKIIEEHINNGIDELIFSGRTDDKGMIVIDKIKYGKYYIIEKEAPEGYQINNEKMFFEIKWVVLKSVDEY